jgi:hypothetical protein
MVAIGVTHFDSAPSRARLGWDISILIGFSGKTNFGLAVELAGASDLPVGCFPFVRQSIGCLMMLREAYLIVS